MSAARVGAGIKRVVLGRGGRAYALWEQVLSAEQFKLADCGSIWIKRALRISFG